MEETKQPDLLIYIKFDYYLINSSITKRKLELIAGLELTYDLLLYTTSSGLWDNFNSIKQRYMFIMVDMIKIHTDSSYIEKL